MKEYAIWLGMTYVITSQREIYQNWQKCKICTEMHETLGIYAIPGDINQLLVTMMQNINVWTHLAPTGHN